MSNLGSYQKFTTLAKKFGGVEKLIGFIATGSAAVGATIGITAFVEGSKIVKSIKRKRKISTEKNNAIYKITSPGKSNEGVAFEIGDEFRILGTDGDVILLEKIGDFDNPYYVDAKFLNKISNYKGGDK